MPQIGLTMPKNRIRCIGGEGAPCIEGSGGYSEEMKEALEYPEAPDPDGWREIFPQPHSHHERYNRYKWDVAEVNKQLARIRL